MRISSNTMFESTVSAMTQQQTQMLHTQQQIATGKRLISPSDDPLVAARALDVTHSEAVNAQYAINRNAAKDSLSIAEGILESVTELMLNIRDTALSAGAPSNTDGTRQAVANSLQSSLQQLVAFANSKDGVGNYMFSGFQTKTPPFVDTSAGVSYFGDDGQRLVQVSASQQMEVSNNGADLFMRIKNGNGSFLTQAAAANLGTGVASLGSVTTPAVLTGNNYSVTFSVAAGVTTYSVNNTTTGLPVAGLTAQPYVSGQAISFDGMKFEVKGAPANGDVFTVVPSTNQSVFSTITNMINTLNTPVVGGNTASLTAGMAQGLAQLETALQNVTNVRATMGLRLNELDATQAAGDNLSLNLKQTLSQLQDTDYAKAITDLTMQQANLQAAQKSFVSVANLSLFSYI